MDVSRIARGKIDLRKQVLDLCQLLNDAVDAVRPIIDAHQHQLKIECPKHPIYVLGDPARLLQVQENLLMNAAKYTSPGGRITISLQEHDAEALISVEDNGSGIAPEMLSVIFDLFVQGHKSLARTEGGMGIGLSLVRLLVELHGGRVTVESRGKDQGSKFTVMLPVTDKRPATQQDNHVPLASSKRIVIVEDNEDSRQTLEQLLRLDGHSVSVAADGRAGYEAIKREVPDVVLLDIGLPEMDGYEVARRIRSEMSDRPIRLVALTGYGRAEDHTAVIQSGFDEHLVKPVNLRDLARVLAK